MPHEMTRVYKLHELQVGAIVEASSTFPTSGAVKDAIRGWIVGKNPFLNTEFFQGTKGIVLGLCIESPDFVIVAFERDNRDTVTTFAHYSLIKEAR